MYQYSLVELGFRTMLAWTQTSCFIASIISFSHTLDKSVIFKNQYNQNSGRFVCVEFIKIVIKI